MSNPLKKYKGNLPAKPDELKRIIEVGDKAIQARKKKLEALRDIPEALAVFNQTLEEGYEVCGIVIDAVDKLGEVLKDYPRRYDGSRAKGIRLGSTRGTESHVQLPSLPKGVDKKLSHIANKIHKYPDKVALLKAQIESLAKDLYTINMIYKKLPKVPKEPRIKEADEVRIKDIKPGWHKLGRQHLYYGSNLDKEFIDKLPHCKFGFADPPYNAGLGDWDVDFKWEQDLFADKCDVFAVTPGGWNAYGFYRETEMPYIWEMVCYIENGMTHGKCGFANFIKVSIFGNSKPKIPQDLFKITIKTSETGESSFKGRKPNSFIFRLLDLFSERDDYIFDIFAGSGTTLIMSEKMDGGRISYNAEINKERCLETINRAIANGMKYEVEDV